MLKRVLLFSCVMLSMLICNGAGAATIVNTDGDVVTSISGLEFNGSTWTADFYSEPGPSPIQSWDTQAEAGAAAAAVASVMQGNGSSREYDWFGPDSSNAYRRAYTYFDEDVEDYICARAIRSSGTDTDWYSSFDDRSRLEYLDGVRGIMTFTDEMAAVPIPGAVWLLGSGLIGMVGIRRKFKK